MDFISILSIFVLACFVGYYVVWSVTPALHTPLMAVTNAISSVIIVGALIAAAAIGPGDTGAGVGPDRIVVLPNGDATVNGHLVSPTVLSSQRSTQDAILNNPREPAPPAFAKWLGLIAVVFASINIFGGFAVTARMLAMYKKKERN